MQLVVVGALEVVGAALLLVVGFAVVAGGGAEHG